MPIAVVFVAGTAIRGIGARVMMRGVMRRHPNAFLVTLERWGVTIPLEESQAFIGEHIRNGMVEQGRNPRGPVVLVGHSQGGLAALRYAVDHPRQVKAVVSVGTPWHGARLAGLVTGVTHRLTGLHVPALRDMSPDSEFLSRLHADLAPIASRVTNIYSTHEVLISPYVSAHVDVPGVTNVLIASQAEYETHLRVYNDDYPVDELIEARVTHLGEMSSPQVRAVIWRVVDEVVARLRLRPPGRR